MKLMHLGDLHLGKTLGDFDLIDDQKYILDRIIDMAEEQGVDAVLIAGDVYDKSIPSESAVNLLDSFLCRLAEKNINVYMISGNHDSDDRLNFGSSLFEANHIFISAIYDGTLKKYTLGKGKDKCNIYLLPFIKASQVKHYFPDAQIENYEDAVRVILDNTDIKDNETNIMVAHQFVSGNGEDPALGGSEGMGTKSVGTVEKIGYSVFDRFDYVALGHIHSPQQVGKKEIRYSGSPLKYSLSEVNNEKSVPIITVSENGKVGFELAPLTPMRDMRHLRGKMKELLDMKNVQGTKDYVYVTLTDEDVINDAMGIFQQTYPNTVSIDYDNSHTREIEQMDISQIVQDKSFSEIIGDFYRLIYGTDISDEEMGILRMAAREAGIINEAD